MTSLSGMSHLLSNTRYGRVRKYPIPLLCFPAFSSTVSFMFTTVKATQLQEVVILNYPSKKKDVINA